MYGFFGWIANTKCILIENSRKSLAVKGLRAPGAPKSLIVNELGWKA